MKKKMNKKGFTIVELVIVIAVIAILAAVLIPTFSNVVTKAKESAALQEVRNAYVATVAEEAETGNYVVGNSTITVTATNGLLVTITNGECAIAAEGASATYKVDGGKIVANAGN